MNYKTLFTAIFINYFVVLNAWAGCCFIGPPSVPKFGDYYSCFGTSDDNDADACAHVPGAVGFANSGSFCDYDGYSCCSPNGKVIFELRDPRTVIETISPPSSGCNDTKALPVVISSFTATLENDGHVSLEGTVTNLGEQAYMNIWRAQIGDLDQDGEKEITNLKKITTAGFSVVPFEQVPFSTKDTNPLHDVNYYVLEEVNMNGKSSVYCDHIQSLALEGTPEPVLAESLCLKYTLVQVFTEF